MPSSTAIAASRAGSSMAGRLAPDQTAADEPQTKCHQKAGERLFLDLAADRLHRPVAVIRQAPVELVGLVAQPLDRVARRSTGHVIGAVLHMLHKTGQIALEHRDVVTDRVEIRCLLCGHESSLLLAPGQRPPPRAARPNRTERASTQTRRAVAEFPG